MANVLKIYRPHYMSTLTAYLPYIIASLGLLLLVLFLVRSAAYSNKIRERLKDYILKPEQPPPINPSIGSGDTVSITKEKESIVSIIKRYPINNYDQVNALIGYLAEARVEVKFWRLHNQIYESQIRFMTGLNQQLGRATREESVAFLKKLGEGNQKIADYSFEKWIQFMVQNDLLFVGVGHFELTAVGQDFLVWITRRQLVPKHE